MPASTRNGYEFFASIDIGSGDRATDSGENGFVTASQQSFITGRLHGRE